MQRESPMKQLAVRIVSTRRVEYLYQSTRTWGAVVVVKEGTIDSIPGNEGRIAPAWVRVRGRLRVFSVCCWHSEGWTPRNEALLEAVLWLVTCDANMGPRRF